MNSDPARGPRNHLEAAVLAFRVGMEAEAGEHMAALIDSLTRRMQEPGGQRLVEGLLPLLPEVLAAQQRGDGLAVADALEHRIAPLLGFPPTGPSH